MENLVYAILFDGTVVLGELVAGGEGVFESPEVIFDNGSKQYGCAMVFPANDDTWAALQMLYEDIPVPELPLTPNEIVNKLLNNQVYVFAKVSAISYADARLNCKIRAVRRRPDGSSHSTDTKNFYVPYDAHGNEIKTV